VPVDPIDSLQTLYDRWKLTTAIRDHRGIMENQVKIIPGAGGQPTFDLAAYAAWPTLTLQIYDICGRLICSTPAVSSRVTPDLSAVPGPAMLIYLLAMPGNEVVGKGKFMFRAHAW
jgi:hypothetical protein